MCDAVRRLSTLLLLAAPFLFQAPVSRTPSAIPSGFDFTGNWDCTGAFRAGQIHRSTFTGAVTLAGKWLELTEMDVEPATGYVAKYLIGYDPQEKHFVEFDANNFGAALYTSNEGWQEHTLIMTSPASQDPKAPYAANRFVYSTDQPNSFTVDWQISKSANLKWVAADHLVCKRRS